MKSECHFVYRTENGRQRCCGRPRGGRGRRVFECVLRAWNLWRLRHVRNQTNQMADHDCDRGRKAASSWHGRMHACTHAHALSLSLSRSLSLFTVLPAHRSRVPIRLTLPHPGRPTRCTCFRNFIGGDCSERVSERENDESMSTTRHLQLGRTRPWRHDESRAHAPRPNATRNPGGTTTPDMADVRSLSSTGAPRDGPAPRAARARRLHLRSTFTGLILGLGALVAGSSSSPRDGSRGCVPERCAGPGGPFGMLRRTIFGAALLALAHLPTLNGIVVIMPASQGALCKLYKNVTLHSLNIQTVQPSRVIVGVSGGVMDDKTEACAASMEALLLAPMEIHWRSFAPDHRGTCGRSRNVAFEDGSVALRPEPSVMHDMDDLMHPQ